ncbi:MAG: competence protein ComEC [Clostridia bacterium]|jgi:competence protein ComEC|nr:competence protein ComEC [Clostridia bacterium]MDN5321744.1 competence protein ComEC [Clostridia bacterium]
MVTNVSRTLVKITIIFALGIIIGYYSNIPLNWSFTAWGGLFLLGIFFLIGKYPYKTFVFFIFLMLWGVIWVDLFELNINILENWQQQKVKVSGQVTSLSQANNQLVLKLNKINDWELKAKPKVVVKLNYQEFQGFQWGDIVTFRGILEKTMPRSNPGGFSEQDYWRQKGVGYKLISSSPGKVEKKAQGLKAVVSMIRDNICKIIKLELPPKERGIILGLLLGDKGLIDDNFYEAAQKLGIAHIFAVSGLHVGVVILFYLVITKFLKIPDTLTLMGAIVILALYSLVTGLTPSVVRASIMAVLGLFAVKLLKYKDFYTFLALAALLILISSPLSLFTIGFQLSFITTWGIVYFSPWIKELLFFLPTKIRLLLVVPFAAQLAALPVVVYHFNLVSLWAPLINILIVPVIIIVVPLLFGALGLAVIWIKLAEPFLLLAGGIIYSLSFLIEILVNSFTRGHFYLAKPHWILVVLYFLILIGWREINTLKKILPVKLGIALGVVFILVLIIFSLPEPGSLEITFLDVGQGDGAVLVTPYRQFIIIDGGPRDDIIARHLQFKGANRVALAVLSHPDHDHITGLFKVIQEFPTEILLIPPDMENSQALYELKKLAEKRNTQVIEGKQGMVIKFPSGLKLKVLSPELGMLNNLDTNNASLVVNCSYGEQDILFTGDIDKFMLLKLLPVLNDIELVKIPHHGSKGSYSEGFYQSIDSDLAVVSAGRSNRYGHPHKIVIEGLTKEGLKIYRTDIQGAIILETDGKDITVKTMLGARD